MNYLDLFSGIGGFHLGLKRAGFKFKWEGHSEIDRYAEQIYHRHFPESECLGDIRTVDPSKLPKINLITFGFPCQDISIAGKREGLRASRSGLFFEAMRIISECKPNIFIFENVKGLFSSSEGRDFEVILRTVADLGVYDCEWQLLNTRWFLPQNRERIYFIGHLRGASRPKVFPIGENDSIFGQTTKSKGTRAQTKCYSTPLRATGNQSMKSDGTFIHLQQIGTLGKDSEATRVYSPDGCARTIKDGGGMGAKTGLYVIEDFYPDRIREFKECPTLRGDRQGLKIGGRAIRRLTPIEAERLQGFPDNWTEGISDSQRYKCLGNAVSVPVVEEIAKRLLI